MTVWYSKGVGIEGSKRDGGKISALKAAKSDEFVETTRKTLDAIKATAMGQAMLDEIDNSGHTVKIYRSWDADEGNSQGGSTNDEMVVPLKKRMSDLRLNLAHVLDRACKDMSDRSAVAKFFGVGKAAPRFLNRDAIAKLLNISSINFKLMETGVKSIDKDTDARLRAYLYDFLTPGPGCDCYVIFNHRKLNLSPGHKQHLPASQNWQNRPLPVPLAHELVHAWRAVSGRVLYDYGWEEEAMTVGLPPFSNMRFTENRFRIEFDNTGLAIRPDYQYIAFATGIIDPGQTGISADKKKWQGNKSALQPLTKDVLKKGLANQRRKAGYGDDDDDGFDEWDE
jgi:hypothetical protein